eukprot:COSAG05_NODE_408_length_10119_cov_10.267166_5_plen_101_part_00
MVGAPCGIMDQMASALGQKGKLLALLCRPAEVQGLVEIPFGTHNDACVQFCLSLSCLLRCSSSLFSKVCLWRCVCVRVEQGSKSGVSTPVTSMQWAGTLS